MIGKVDINNYGGLLLDPGYEGMVVDMQVAQIDNAVNNGGTTGLLPIDFGVAVGRGPSSGAFSAGQVDQVKPIQADGDVVIGISVRHPIQVGQYGTDYIAYEPGDALPIMKDGKVWIQAYENVTQGDQALSLTAQAGRIGGVTGGAAGAGRVVIPGAVWLDTTAAGQLGRVRIKS